MAKKTAPDQPPTTELAELAQLVLGLRAEIADLKKERTPTQLARGTDTPVERPSTTPEERVRAALIGQPQSIEELSTALSMTPATVETIVNRLRQAKRVVPTTRGRGQRYVWRPENWTNDDPTAKEERRKIIVGLLMEHAKGQSDILDILEVPEEFEKNIEYDVIEIRRHEPVWWLNKDTGGRGRANMYWIRPDRKEPPPELDGRIPKTARKKTGAPTRGPTTPLPISVTPGVAPQRRRGRPKNV